jgi:hypothetical protein
MNGVRRFLGNPTSAVTKDRPGTSRSPSPTKELPPPPSPGFTRGLFIRKDRKPPLPVAGPSSTNSSPTTTTPPLRRKAPPPEWEEPPDLPPHPPTNGVQLVNTRDALLLSLMSSEAMVDSRGYEILSAEEVEELKKVRGSPFRINHYPNLFRRRSTQYCLRALERSKESSQRRSKSATQHRTLPDSTPPHPRPPLPPRAYHANHPPLSKHPSAK